MLPPSSHRELSSPHSMATRTSHLIWFPQQISEPQMSVPTWQIRKLRLQEGKDYFPSLFISLVEEKKVLETRSSDPKSSVLSFPLVVNKQVITNKAQSSKEPETIPGHDLCLFWTQERKQSFASRTQTLSLLILVTILNRRYHYIHFINEDTRAQRQQMACPQSRTKIGGARMSSRLWNCEGPDS